MDPSSRKTEHPDVSSHRRDLGGLSLKTVLFGAGTALDYSSLGPSHDGYLVETRRALTPSVSAAPGALKCRVYAGSDFVAGIALDGLRADDVTSVYVLNRNGKFEIEYPLGPETPTRDGRPFIPASTWPLTPTVFTPQADIVVGLRRQRGPLDPGVAAIVYDVYMRPGRLDALLRGAASRAPAVLGVGGHRIVAGETGYDLFDDRGVRVNQF